MANQQASKTVKRVYVVTERTQPEPYPIEQKVVEHLVRAASQAQAVAFVVRGRFFAEVADVDAAMRLTAAGVKTQDAGASE